MRVSGGVSALDTADEPQEPLRGDILKVLGLSNDVRVRVNHRLPDRQGAELMQVFVQDHPRGEWTEYFVTYWSVTRSSSNWRGEPDWLPGLDGLSRVVIDLHVRGVPFLAQVTPGRTFPNY